VPSHRGQCNQSSSAESPRQQNPQRTACKQSPLEGRGGGSELSGETTAAQRALAEAAARRAEIDARTTGAPKENGGRGGLDPVRYGDWEIKGLTADF
jgi:hypothetical protein